MEAQGFNRHSYRKVVGDELRLFFIKRYIPFTYGCTRN